MNPFALIWKSIKEVYDNLFPLVGMNLLWLILSLPLLIVVSGILLVFRLDNTIAFAAAILFAAIGPNPASIGIHRYANGLVHEQIIDFGFYWSGLREYWRRSLVLSLIGVIGTGILGVNLYFYLNTDSQVLHIFAILWLYAIILWSMMLLYMGPLLVEQQNKGIFLIIKNAFLLAIDNLPASFVILVVLLVICLVSIPIALLLALVTTAFIVMVETQAVSAYLEKYRIRAAKTAT